MLDDEKTYSKLKSDPTAKYKRKLISILARVKREGNIAEQQCFFLYPSSEAIPRLYCTTKIHKTTTPIRPIVNYTGSVVYNVSRSLADLLSPMVGLTQHHIKNSRHLAVELKSMTLHKNEMCSRPVMLSLFTSTPIPKIMEIIKTRLQKDKTLTYRTRLET